jgi:beta-N-acetylhexosaminidase
MARRRRLGTLLAAAVAVLAVAPGMAGEPPSPRPSISWRTGPLLSDGPHPDRQLEILSRKIGQLLMIGFVGTEPSEPAPRRIAAMIAARELGGVILFGDNVRNPRQLQALTAGFVAAGGATPPLVAVDQEGGGIQRLTRRKGFQALPSARTMGRKPLCEAEALYRRTATELAAMGINLNFGPVVDLDINPRNPAIGKLARSYDRDPERVLAYADAFITGHEAAGVLTVAKHFPGHGSAARDPHIAIVDIADVWEPVELSPFAALAAGGRLPMVMVGHLIHPRFSDGDRPTSLSRRAITEVLRDRLGFDGVVVTDDLGMDAVARRYRPEETAVLAIRAGADLLIFAHAETERPGTIARIVATVAAAVAAGRLPERRVEEAYERLHAVRTALGTDRALPATASPCSDAERNAPAGDRRG